MSRKKYGKFEGGQYRGGREKGRKNLKRTDKGTLLNQHGIEFTVQEKKALESAVNRVNRMRNKMLKEYDGKERYFAGRRMGDTLGNLRLMGKESDVLLSRKTKSLQRFKSKSDFNKYLDQMQGLNYDDYVADRLRAYKRNHMKALENTYGDEAKDVIMKIRMMKPEEYRKYIERDEASEIGFIYDDNEAHNRLNKIRASFGMKLKEDYIDDI